MTRFAPARRALSALLALLCPLTAGCAAPAVQETPRTPPAATATPQATATPAPSPTPQDTGEAARLFAALDAEAFAAYAQRSGARVRALLADPAAQGLSDAAASWGDPSPEAAQAYAGACAELLERLFEIDRSALGEGEQLAYDVLQRYWEQTVAAASCAMYEEPFAPETGAQVWLPQALRLMRIETQDDAEAYVSLVEDAPRYLAALLELEQARAAEGLFLTEQALSSVLGQIDALLAGDGRAALLTAFSEALSRMEGLTDAQREAYEARAQALYDGAFADGWIALREGLAALSDQCRRKEGLYALGEQAQEYFALAMQRQAASALTPEDALLLLEQEYAYQYRAYYELNLSVDEAAARRGAHERARGGRPCLPAGNGPGAPGRPAGDGVRRAGGAGAGRRVRAAAAGRAGAGRRRARPGGGAGGPAAHARARGIPGQAIPLRKERGGCVRPDAARAGAAGVLRRLGRVRGGAGRPLAGPL